MSELRAAAESYLAMRRTLGFKLTTQGRALMRFVDYCEAHLTHPETRASSIGFGLLPFHAEAADRRSRHLDARYRLASQRAPARLVPGFCGHPGFDVTCICFDTSTAIRSRSPSRSPPDTSHAPFPHRSPRSRRRSRRMWWFEASPRRATPKGRQSFISCTAPLHEALPTSNSSPRSGHTHKQVSICDSESATMPTKITGNRPRPTGALIAVHPSGFGCRVSAARHPGIDSRAPRHCGRSRFVPRVAVKTTANRLSDAALASALCIWLRCPWGCRH